ncbi:MAG: FtsX-like permease family protein, partial [Candidatus Bathyarchaeia archaeon]
MFNNKGLRVASINVILLIVLLYIWTLTSQLDFVHAEENKKIIKVYGFVGELGTNKPLDGAKVGIVRIIWSDRRAVEQYVILAETNSSGLFEIYLDSPGTYNFFAYCDYNSTPGVDYIPAYRGVNIEDKPQQLTFLLIPGASINIIGDPFFSLEEEFFSCKVNDEKGFLQLIGAVREIFGSRYEPIENRTIFVPANIGFKIEIETYKFGARIPFRRITIVNFTIPTNGSYLYLRQGEQMTLNLKNYRLELEARRGLPELLEYVKSLADKVGVLSSYERVRISNAEKILKKGISFLSQGNYINAHTDLYEAYLILSDVKESLLSMFQNSIFSIYFITPFTGISSFSLGALLFKDKRKRIFAGILIYVLLILLLYYTYPGYTLLQDPTYNLLAGTPLEHLLVPSVLFLSFIAGFLLTNFPYTYGEKSDRRTLSLRSAIVAVFSLAAENLKRRKLRTTLVMAIISISIFAFITLTSFSYESGLIIDKIKKGTPSNGLLIIQQSNNSEVYPYGPVDLQVIEWINKREGALLTIPLLKNMPQVGSPPEPLDSLLNPNLGLRYNIFGVLGVKPSLESNITGINRIVSGENMGRFLADNDFNGILISQEARNALQVKVNDTIVFCGRNFTVVGVFESAKLGEIIDLDGKSILPQKVHVVVSMGGLTYLPYYVPPENVVIILDQTALKLPINMIISRIVVQSLELKYEDMFSLARSVTLLFPRVEAFISLYGEITHLHIGHQLISYGFGSIFLLLVLTSLNVCVMLLNSVYERRREIQTLSTVGLNPSQISAIYVCEALIMAFIAGSLGYLFGLTSYLFFNLFQSAPALKYKAEAFWSIISLCFSIIASVVGSLTPALKASVIVTPSLLRRFIISPIRKGEALVVDIPLRIKEKDLKDFFNFMLERMKEYSDPTRVEERVDDVRLIEDKMNPLNMRLHFIYKYAVNRVITENDMFIVKD